MSSAPVKKLLGLVLGCVIAGCAHPQTSTGESKIEAIAPMTATPHSVLTEEDVQRVPAARAR